MLGVNGCSPVESMYKLHVNKPESTFKKPADFPALYFLDFAAFNYRQQTIPKIVIPLPRFILDSVQDPHFIANQFFEKIHPIMPLISKRPFLARLSVAFSQADVDLNLLIFCMKLLVWSPADNPLDTNPKSPAYLAAKRSLVELDIAGIITIRTLQATVLVSLYELGHAIYPSAYTSIGACARLALVLGLDQTLDLDLNSMSYTLLEQEERRRAWWSILTLDRFVHLMSSCLFCFE